MSWEKQIYSVCCNCILNAETFFSYSVLVDSIFSQENECRTIMEILLCLIIHLRSFFKKKIAFCIKKKDLSDVSALHRAAINTVILYMYSILRNSTQHIMLSSSDFFLGSKEWQTSPLYYEEKCSVQIMKYATWWNLASLFINIRC